jgi:hypothetical protein
MKQRKLLILIFLLAFFPLGGVHAQIVKLVKVGKIEARVYDHGCQSADVYERGMIKYFRGSYVSVDDRDSEYPIQLIAEAGLLFGARNWVDITGDTLDVMVTGHCARERELDIYQFAVPDEEGITIRRIFAYPPPQIIVDGVHCEPAWGSLGDEVAPEKIWGTADLMVESDVRLSMGLDVKQRVLAWSQPDHDDYVIWDLTFVNTGNVDRDPDIELPDQTLEDVYIARITEAMINGAGDNKVMPTYAGTTENHDTRLSYPQDDDSLRIDYVTPLRAGTSTTRDSYGLKVDAGVWNILTGARFGGSMVLFAPKSCDVPQSYNPSASVAASNDPAQPSMHTSLLAEPSWMLLHNGILADFNTMTASEFVDAYEIMVKGVFGIDPTMRYFQDAYPMDNVYDVYDTTASGAPTYYEQPLDRWGELDPSRGWVYMTDIPESSDYRRWDQECHCSIGPYQMEFGDTLRYVFAYVGGAINRKTSYLAGEAWESGEAASYDWLAGLDSAQMVDELSRRDPIFDVYYGYSGDREFNQQPSLNDIAKDLLVATGKDSLFNNGMNAQRNFNMNYEVPESPAPPSVFEVASGPDMIRLTWSYESGYEPSDLAKFKIYRALGGYVYEKQGEIIIGDWQLIDSVNGTQRIYEDTAVTPAVDYYYAITAVSPSGSESGMFLTMTEIEANLQSYPVIGNLDSIRVVPNPLNVNSSARSRYSEGDGLKVTFVELPPECTITILTESGELVRTIEHTNGSGTEVWKASNQFLLTNSDQQPASGIYIAHIKTPDGQSISRKFLIVR